VGADDDGDGGLIVVEGWGLFVEYEFRKKEEPVGELDGGGEEENEE